MFDAVARRYDITNTVLSVGQDRCWRRATRRHCESVRDAVLDLAAGTRSPPSNLLAPVRGVSPRTSRSACSRPACSGRCPKLRPTPPVCPFADGVFDAVTISFGLRNVVDFSAGLREMARDQARRTAGGLRVLDAHRAGVFDALQREYLMQALPRVARAVSSNPEAYVYLVESIRAWPDQPTLARHIEAAGWSQVRWRNLTGDRRPARRRQTVMAGHQSGAEGFS